MLVKHFTIAMAVQNLVFAAPLPLHNTNTQRLPDHPAIIDHPNLPAIVMVQKHKYIPEITDSILKLCGRALGY